MRKVQEAITAETMKILWTSRLPKRMAVYPAARRTALVPLSVALRAAWETMFKGEDSRDCVTTRWRMEGIEGGDGFIAETTRDGSTVPRTGNFARNDEVCVETKCQDV